MKYITYSLIMIALSATMFGQNKTVQFGYTHYETTADPKNGQNCVAGTVNCIGGGTSTSVIPSPDGCIPPKTLVTTTPGVYSNFIKVLDDDLSTLSNFNYLVKRKSDNATLYNVTISVGGGWPSSPTNFSATLQVAPNTANVQGTYYKSADGTIMIVSPSIPGSALSNTDALIVTVDPSCSPTAGTSGSMYTSVGGVDEPVTQEFSATAIAAMSKTGKLIPGDVKYSELNTDHDGWYKLDGRSIASITNVSAKTVASSLYSGSLPDMSQKYFYADHASADRLTYDGQNSFTVTNSNIQSFGINVNPPSNYGWVGYNGNGTVTGSYSFDYSWPGEPSLTFATNGAGSATIGTGSPSSIDNRPVSKRMYAFVYLGD